MNILSVIEKDHKAVKKIFRELEKISTSPSSRASELVQSLVLEIKLHAKAEELALYKACHEKSGRLHDFSLEGAIEHRLLEVVLGKLTKVQPGADGEFKALLTVAKQLFEHHAEEEEQSEIFPKLKRAFRDQQLNDMGERMIMLKEKLRPRLETQVLKAPSRLPQRQAGSERRIQ